MVRSDESKVMKYPSFTASKPFVLLSGWKVMLDPGLAPVFYGLASGPEKLRLLNINTHHGVQHLIHGACARSWGEQFEASSCGHEAIDLGSLDWTAPGLTRGTIGFVWPRRSRALASPNPPLPRRTEPANPLSWRNTYIYIYITLLGDTPIWRFTKIDTRPESACDLRAKADVGWMADYEWIGGLVDWTGLLRRG